MHLKMLCCKIIEREVSLLAASSRNVVDVTMIRQKLHDKPENLNRFLQSEIDAIEAGSHPYSNQTEFDAILLGYALCSHTVVGLHTRRVPLVIPRAHDCVTLLMGDRHTYMAYYMQNAGTFYYWPGAAEQMDYYDEDRYRRSYAFYLNRYRGDERKARKAVDKEKSLFDRYGKITYIDWASLPFPEYEEELRRDAAGRFWAFEKLDGRDTLLRDLLNGNWSEDRFLVIQPGQTAVPSYDDGVIRAVELEEYLENPEQYSVCTAA